MTESPELRELKKHTRVMAKKEANRAGAGGCVLGAMLGGVIVFLGAAYSPWALAIGAVLPVVCAVLFYRLEFKEVVDGSPRRPAITALWIVAIMAALAVLVYVMR